MRHSPAQIELFVKSYLRKVTVKLFIPQTHQKNWPSAQSNSNKRDIWLSPSPFGQSSNLNRWETSLKSQASTCSVCHYVAKLSYPKAIFGNRRVPRYKCDQHPSLVHRSQTSPSAHQLLPHFTLFDTLEFYPPTY